MRVQKLLSLSILCALTMPLRAETNSPGTPALTIKGDEFVDAAGTPVRFWGVNLVALYPEHAQADAMAKNLASLGINLARPHHLLRRSLDWNPKMVSGALVTYKNDSREIEPVALDRFDYLNAALQKNGIYLALSAHFSRLYRPGDVDILKTDEQDREAWMNAMKELNGWDWKKGIDVYKMLPGVDERAALLNEEFIKFLLTHVNPYTGKSYASDPQVLMLEVRNEGSTEYAVICGNRFPDYWHAKLVEKWNAYAAEAGIAPGDLYKPADAKAKEVRAKFLRKLDEDYFNRIKAVVRNTGSKVPMTFSNLWFGDNALELHARTADVIENHGYIDPLAAGANEDGFVKIAKSEVVGKPFFVGELNQAEGEENIRKQSPFRSMLPLASAAYGSLHNWSGIVWFAWLHGGQELGENGWSPTEGRTSKLGNMLGDGMMIDHLRTTGIIFRRGLVRESEAPITIWIDEPFISADYNGLMRGKKVYQPGWQNVSSVRKAFGPVPAGEENPVWMKQSPPNPLVSDTEEIVKDVARKQLTVAAPQAEAFSGYLDERAPAALKHLRLEGKGFATVVLVADDGNNFGSTGSLIISRTAINASNQETEGPAIKIGGLQTPAGKNWYVRLTRPRQAAELIQAFTSAEDSKIEVAQDGSITLPNAGWHECELRLR